MNESIEKTNKEKAKEIGKKYARQYHHNTFEGGLKNSKFVFSDEECIKSAIEMAEYKDLQIKDILMKYTLWLNTRGFFAEDLQCDFNHQIDTFLEMSNIKVDKGE